MRLFALLCAIGITITGCGPSQAELEAEAARKEAALEAKEAALEAEKIEALKAKVASSLKDPASAQFSLLRYLPESDSLCGEVNAKNSMGGYVGFKPFAVSADGNAVILKKLSLKSVLWTDEEAQKMSKLFFMAGDKTSALEIIQDQVLRTSFKHWANCTADETTAPSSELLPNEG